MITLGVGLIRISHCWVMLYTKGVYVLDMQTGILDSIVS
jgi:hypothetical protein